MLLEVKLLPVVWFNIKLEYILEGEYFEVNLCVVLLIVKKKKKTLFTLILFRTITFTQPEEFIPFFHFYQSIFSDTKTPQSFPEAQNVN